MKPKKIPFSNLDWWLVLGTFLLLLIGALNQASATMGGLLFKKQLLWFALGLVLMWGVAFLDYQKILSPRLVLATYVGLCVLLLFLDLKHTRWLRIGGLGIQPSEFAKLVLILSFSLLLYRRQEEHLDWRTAGLLTLLALPPTILVAAGDLDQGGMLFLLYLSYLFLAGIPKRWLIGVSLLVLVLGVSLGPKAWSLLKPYQRARVEAFLNPEAFRLDRGYQILQALIAVGSGGLTGLGFKEGLSSRLNYLPEKHTDLAFAVWSEEWGFIGATLVVGLFFLLIYRLLRLSLEVREPLGRTILAGVAIMFFWESLINIGGIIHLLPVASVPLPFLSYGGSSVLVNMLALGLALSISRRRYSFR